VQFKPRQHDLDYTRKKQKTNIIASKQTQRQASKQSNNQLKKQAKRLYRDLTHEGHDQGRDWCWAAMVMGKAQPWSPVALVCATKAESPNLECRCHRGQVQSDMALRRALEKCVFSPLFQQTDNIKKKEGGRSKEMANTARERTLKFHTLEWVNLCGSRVVITIRSHFERRRQRSDTRRQLRLNIV
jgi:hypothetical protein